MKISVIVWFFDKISNLKQTFNSIQNQEYNNIEIIIINDAETDEKNIEFLLFFNGILLRNNILIITRLKSEGFSSSVNLARKYATGKYAWFLKEGELFTDKEVLKNIFSNKNVISNKPDMIETVMSANRKSSPMYNKCLMSDFLYNIKVNKEVLVYMNMYIETKIFNLDKIKTLNLNFNINRNYDLLFIYKFLFNTNSYMYLNIHSLITTDQNFKFSYLNLLNQWSHIFNYLHSDVKYELFIEEIIYSFFKYTLFTYFDIIKSQKNKVLNKKSISLVSKKIKKKINLYSNNKYIKFNANDNFNNYSDDIEGYLKKITKQYI